MTYKTETRTVYITEDGKEYDTPEEALRAGIKDKIRRHFGVEFADGIFRSMATSKMKRDAIRELLATYDEPQAPKADADGWIEWNGGKRPVKGKVVYRMRSGMIDETPRDAKELRWFSLGPDFEENDIVAYRVISD